MRKMKKFFVAILVGMIACACFLFTGCSSKGTYKFEKMSVSVQGISVSMAIGDEYMGEQLTEDFVTLTLDKDKTATLRISLGTGYDDVMIGTWSEKKDEVYLVFEDETVIATKDGKTLTGKFDGATFTLTK